MQGLLRDVLGVRISLGALSQSEEVVANAVDAPVEEARQSAMAAAVKHADGTTWYRGHAFRSLWVLATKGVTVFGLFDSGTAVALKKWMGTKGILVSDRGSQLHFWDMRRRQLCWAHLIRKFAWYAEQPGDTGELGLALVGLAQRVLHEWHRARDGCITRTTFARNIRATRDTIEFLLRAGTRHDAIAGSCANTGPRCGASSPTTASSRPTTMPSRNSAASCCGASLRSAVSLLEAIASPRTSSPWCTPAGSRSAMS